MRASEREIRRRVEAIRYEMAKEDLQGLIVFSQAQMGSAGSIRYISNYRLTTRKGYLFVPLSGEPALILPTVGQRMNALAQSWIKDIRCGGDDKGMIKEVSNVIRAFQLEDSNIGIAGLDILPFFDYQLLTQQLPRAHFKDATDLINRLRWRKSEEEIRMTMETAEILDRCHDKLLGIIKPGKNEMELVGEISKFLAETGIETSLILTAKGPSFAGFVDHPSPYVFQHGDHYIFSVEAAGPSGYWSQIVRFFALGTPSPVFEKLFKVAKYVIATGTANLVPGKRVGEIVKLMLETVEQEGLKTGLWFGHGMGLDVGDNLGLSQDSDVEITENMVITIHPHVMSRDGRNGLMIGDTFVVGKEGPMNLSQRSCSFEVL